LTHSNCLIIEIFKLQSTTFYVLKFLISITEASGRAQRNNRGHRHTPWSHGKTAA